MKSKNAIQIEFEQVLIQAQNLENSADELNDIRKKINELVSISTTTYEEYFERFIYTEAGNELTGEVFAKLREKFGGASCKNISGIDKVAKFKRIIIETPLYNFFEIKDAA